MGFNQQNGGFNGIYPLVMTNSSLLKMAIEIVDFPSKIVMFHIVMLVFQRVYKTWGSG